MLFPRPTLKKKHFLVIRSSNFYNKGIQYLYLLNVQFIPTTVCALIIGIQHLLIKVF